MKFRTRSLAFIAVVCGIAALPARAVTPASGFVIGEGPGKLVDALIANGYGNYNLYSALVAIQNNTSPALYGVLTIAFVTTLQGVPREQRDLHDNDEYLRRERSRDIHGLHCADHRAPGQRIQWARREHHAVHGDLGCQ